MMFFGCRSEKSDYFFMDEWEDLVKCKKLLLFNAFSRDQVVKLPFKQHKYTMNHLYLSHHRITKYMSNTGYKNSPNLFGNG